MTRIFLGIDVGGSSIKAGAVDVMTGELVAPEEFIATPQPATPAAVAAAVRILAARFALSGPVGFAFPSVVRRGVAYTAANVDKSWIGTNGEELIERTLGRSAVFLNDADAAGLAEIHLGAARGCVGTVLLLTFGTGIGSALFVDGMLLPNTELGHLRVQGGEAEVLASGRTRAVQQLGWPEWAERVNVVLTEMYGLLWPDLIVFGGGLTEHYETFLPFIRCPTELRVARFRAHAGVVGAALAAARRI